MAHHFILLRLNPVTLGLIGMDSGLSTLCHSSGFACCLSAGGAKNVSWHWLSPLRGWGSLAMSLTGKFVCVCVYIYIYYVTNFQLYKLHNKTLRNQVSVMVSLMTL